MAVVFDCGRCAKKLEQRPHEGATDFVKRALKLGWWRSVAAWFCAGCKAA